ncbi:folylpolyglutamate synthase [Thecaphora frezii]
MLILHRLSAIPPPHAPILRPLALPHAASPCLPLALPHPSSLHPLIHHPPRLVCSLSPLPLPSPLLVRSSPALVMATSTHPPRGASLPLLTLRTLPPLPAFAILYGVPNEQTSISSLKLSIVRILTGETVSSSTKPLTFSEELKQKTINGWRIHMLQLQLRQQPTTPPSSSFPSFPHDHALPDETLSGFELLDQHDCSLLEHGDEIIVRLKPGHQLKDLQLPDLGPKHKYSAPAGTLSQPPPYAVATPSEPSSHSSSVAAQPNANYHQHSYHDYRQGFRVVTANNVGGGRACRVPANAAASAITYGLGVSALGSGLNMVGNPSRASRTRKASGKKDKAAPPLKPAQRAMASLGAVAAAEATPPTSPVLASPPASSTPASSGMAGQRTTPNSRRNSSSAATQSQQSQSQPLAQPRRMSNSQGKNNDSSGGGGSQASGKASGKMSMPLTALVLGPGVQGAVGRNASSAAAPMGTSGAAAVSSDEYGNANAFVGFTAASVEVRARPKRQMSKSKGDDTAGSDSITTRMMPESSAPKAPRRPNSASNAAARAHDTAADVDAQATAGENGNGAGPSRLASGRTVRDRQASGASSQQQSIARPTRMELPAAPVLPPIQNLAPFTETPTALLNEHSKERDLSPMPSAVSRNYISEASQLSNQAGPGPGPCSFLPGFNSKCHMGASTLTSTPGTPTSPILGHFGELPINDDATGGADALAHSGDALPLSKPSRAERRYAEVQQGLAKEREKQAEAERVRREEIRAAEEKKAKELGRKEAEARQKTEERKWEIWEEVRRRQKSGAPCTVPTPVAVVAPTTKRQKGQAAASPAIAADSVEQLNRVYIAAPLRAVEASADDRDGVTASNTNASASTSFVSLPASPPPTAGAASTSNDNDNGSGDGPRIELGLERITTLLQRLGSPHLQFPVIHVAGTNGKGSTIAYLDALLRSAFGIRTATFVSPHLVERRDSCHVNGAVIAKDVWRLAQADVLEADQGLDLAAHRRAANDDGGPLKATPFELLAAQAFCAFALVPQEERPEVLLIEVGLGGRLDATNVFDPSQVLASVICPIAKDHEAFLGSDLAAIAREKAGIVKQGGLCVVADQRGTVEASESPSADNEVGENMDQTALGPLANETNVLGARVAGILDAIRNVCAERNAKLVKGSVPLSLLSSSGHSASLSLSVPQNRYGVQIDFSPTLGPTLSLSTSGYNPPSTFVAHPGDPPSTGPRIKVEKTRANILAASTALQVLWSIARDEVVGDRWEQLRTRIVWGMRDEEMARREVSRAVQETRWRGRCEWVPMASLGHGHARAGTSARAGAGDGEGKGEGWLLMDGAHNPASILALAEYICDCLVLSPSAPSQISWMLAYTQGKDFLTMVDTLFSLLPGPSSLPVHHRIALVPFRTPEGMPWVKSGEVTPQVATQVERIVQAQNRSVQVATFDGLEQGLQWMGSGGKNTFNVVAGSLYLVSDIVRTYAL